ncbi:MAG: AAA family ATPase, partial [Myxococcales bacterium]|nr:AAA family ATPase [Myxococcales bacterium]
EVGSGKTTLCRAVLSNLGKDVETALILNPSLSDTQLLRAMLNDFGIEIKGRDRLTYIEKLNDFLLEKNREGTNVALVIDEAQNLSPQVMEQVRLLSNLETDKHKLIQMVLCGQPELEKRLARPDLRQLRQRIVLRHDLKAFDPEETQNYVEERLRLAGYTGKGIFKRSAYKAIQEASRGIPRLINAICDSALLLGFAREELTLGSGAIAEVVADLGMSDSGEPQQQPPGSAQEASTQRTRKRGFGFFRSRRRG